ncbi:MAG: aromatic-ring-hydroxylating dioxygenase subunit beta [Acidobacteria bacterium]|nr:aromatic-ring-hydroxylating dioxygenase subunit beta [Acidobacteriota bacterium]
MTSAAKQITRQQVEDFLFHEAALLDEWRLSEWLDLFTKTCGYYVPPTDVPEGDHHTSLFLIADDRERLESRVGQLMGRFVHAEHPRSRTRRLISNVRIREPSGDTLRVTSNFIVYRIRLEVTDAYVGRYEHTLVHRDGGLKIRERRAILDLDALRPQGKISILL